MVLDPGETTTLSMQFMMHVGMEGKHNFELLVKSNDPEQPAQVVNVLSNWVP